MQKTGQEIQEGHYAKRKGGRVVRVNGGLEPNGDLDVQSLQKFGGGRYKLLLASEDVVDDDADDVKDDLDAQAEGDGEGDEDEERREAS